MKEIIINLIGAFLLVYMVLAVAVFAVIIGGVFLVMLMLESVLGLVSSMIKGPGISIKRGSL